MEAAAQAFSAAIEHVGLVYVYQLSIATQHQQATKDVGPAFRCLQNSFERIQEFLGAHTMGNEVNRASLDVALDALDSHALAQLQRSLLGCGVLWKCVQFQDAVRNSPIISPRWPQSLLRTFKLMITLK